MKKIVPCFHSALRGLVLIIRLLKSSDFCFRPFCLAQLERKSTVKTRPRRFLLSFFSSFFICSLTSQQRNTIRLNVPGKFSPAPFVVPSTPSTGQRPISDKRCIALERLKRVFCRFKCEDCVAKSCQVCVFCLLQFIWKCTNVFVESKICIISTPLLNKQMQFL